MDNNPIYLLWTSGMDSTYRLIELSRMEGIIVQPVYISGMRTTENLEISAQKRILESLSKKPDVKAIINPVEYVNVKDIPKNEDVLAAYKKIRETINLGIQYDTLSMYAATLPGLIEIGSEGGEEGTMRMTEAIRQEGGYIKQGDTFILDPNKATEVGKLAFGHYSFPILETSESKMLENVKAWGCEDIMKLIWFCHAPIDGKPCGLCRPCEVKMQNHMEWLLPEEAWKRFKVKRAIWKVFGVGVANELCKRIYPRK